MVYSKAIRLVMKGFRRSFFGERHGIWSINCFSQQQTVMIIDKSSTQDPKCLARAEGVYNMVIE